MIKLSAVKGAVFDVDETLLDTTSLHAKARLQTLHEIGRSHDLPALLKITPEQNRNFFLDAPVHSLEGAIWQTLFATGLVPTRSIEPKHPLLLEIVHRKNKLYMALLRTEAKPYPGAIEFIDWLAGQGLGEHLAIASTAVRQELELFVEMFGLGHYFPPERIIAKDNVEHVKPHPEAFDKAFKSLGLPDGDRAKVLAFEDNPRGVLSAKGAGLYVCCITTIYSKKDLLGLDVPPDLVADSFDEFRQLLES
jgi:HAD superfamily hydrolase (TIGR01509 family)